MEWIKLQSRPVSINNTCLKKLFCYHRDYQNVAYLNPQNLYILRLSSGQVCLLLDSSIIFLTYLSSIDCKSAGE